MTNEESLLRLRPATEQKSSVSLTLLGFLTICAILLGWLVELGKYIPDIIFFEQVIIDTKTIEQITDHEVGQMLNYLKVTGLQVGLLINFKHAKLQWKRVVLQRK